MRLATCFLAGLTGVFVLVDLARGDTWAGPRSSIYGCGRYGVKILLKRRSIQDLFSDDAQRKNRRTEVTAMLFTLKDDGSENVLWRKPIEYIPADVRVSHRGWVVGVNQYARLGYNHSLVIWNPKGVRLADYKLEDLLTPDEIRAHVMRTTSSRRWRADFDFRHDGYQGTYDFLLVRMYDSRFRGDEEWEKLITVDLRTGKIWPDFDPGGFRHSYAAHQHAISEYRAEYSKPTATAVDHGAGGDFVRLFARQNKSANAWELYVEADGTATLRIKRGEETRFKLSPGQMEQITKALRESDFAGLPTTLEGVNNDPHLRSIIIETAAGTRGMTVFAPNQLTAKEDRKQAGRFLDCWLVIRDLFDDPNAVDERAEIRDFKP